MKVGVRVRVIKGTSFYKTGAEGVITEVSNYSADCFKVKFDYGDYDKSLDKSWYIYGERMKVIPSVVPVDTNRQRFWAVVANEEIYEICHTRQEARDYREYILNNYGVFKKASVRKVDVTILKEKV